MSRFSVRQSYDSEVEIILWANAVLVTCNYEEYQWTKALTVNPTVFWETEETSIVHTEDYNIGLAWGG